MNRFEPKNSVPTLTPIPSTLILRKSGSALLSLSLILLSSCATLFGNKSKDAERDEALQRPVTQAQFESFREVMQKLSTRLENLETKLTQVSDKVDLARASLESFQPNTSSVTTTVLTHPTERNGVSLGNASQGKIHSADQKSIGTTGAQAGFVQDPAVALYRKGMIQFDSKKYSESILTFSEFVEQFPDHPLAGSAQFRVGESYFQQKENKLALSEFQRVVTTYDRSPHISDTLNRIAEIADSLKMTELAQRTRQTLQSLFAGSPASERQMSPISITPPPSQAENQTAKNEFSASTPAGISVPTAPIQTAEPPSLNEETELK